jgi:phosphoglycolate phosphatase
MVELSVPIPPVLDLLPALKSSGFQLALFTGKYRDRVERTLARHGLLHLFACLVCGDEAPGKPNPEGIARIIARWAHLDLRDFVLIGDHFLDIAAAKNAGIECISVSTGRTPRQVLEGSGPSVVIQDLSVLPLMLSIDPPKS